MEPRRPRALIALAAAVAVALVAAVAVVALTREDDDPAVSTAPDQVDEPTTVTEATDAPNAFDATVAAISDFVAKERDLPFQRAVEVTLLPDEQFAARVREDALEDLDEIATTEAVLGALELLPDDLDLAETLSSFLGDSVVGFYDPETDELVVRGAELTPYVRSTLAHELTHALDDQHFELDRPALDDADDESGVGFAVLAEGDAVRVQEAFEATLSGSERDELRAEEAELGAGIDMSKVPPVLPLLIGFPYQVGPAVIDALRAQGGERRVDQAFSEPPRTSEQAIDPAGWLAGQADPVVVPPPPADGEVIDEGAVGMLGLIVLLREALGQQDAAVAAAGWGGDWYVAWHQGDATCVRTSVAMDTPTDLEELGAALDVWAAEHDQADVQHTADAVTFTACG